MCVCVLARVWFCSRALQELQITRASCMQFKTASDGCLISTWRHWRKWYVICQSKFLKLQCDPSTGHTCKECFSKYKNKKIFPGNSIVKKKKKKNSYDCHTKAIVVIKSWAEIWMPLVTFQRNHFCCCVWKKDVSSDLLLKTWFLPPCLSFRVAEMEEVNKMGAKNLIVIFGPTLMTSESFPVSLVQVSPQYLGVIYFQGWMDVLVTLNQEDNSQTTCTEVLIQTTIICCSFSFFSLVVWIHCFIYLCTLHFSTVWGNVNTVSKFAHRSARSSFAGWWAKFCRKGMGCHIPHDYLLPVVIWGELLSCNIINARARVCIVYINMMDGMCDRMLVCRKSQTWFCCGNLPMLLFTSFRTQKNLTCSSLFSDLSKN